MIGKSNRRRPRRVARRRASTYVLFARTPTGRVRAERFGDAASYRARLARLDRSGDGGLSIDEIVSLLDGQELPTD